MGVHHPALSVCGRDRPRAVESHRGFGSIPVEVSIGGSVWQTLLFPDKAAGSFLLPIKRAIRDREGIKPGDVAEVTPR